jgi:hypothetical protein
MHEMYILASPTVTHGCRKDTINYTNELLSAANERLAEAGRHRGVLLLFDNLDRYPPDRIDEVLFRSADLIRMMKCHAIFSIPIGLEYDPLSGPIQDHYGFSVVLPVLALRHKNHGWDDTVANSRYREDAVAMVRQGLDRRLCLRALFDDPADVDMLIRHSGGCIRDLMHLVNTSYRHSTGGSFQRDAVQRAISAMRSTYIRRLNEEDYQRLAVIALRSKPVHRDALTDRLLYHRFALEYLDGTGEPWIDIHPLVLEIEEFSHALKAT